MCQNFLSKSKLWESLSFCVSWLFTLMILLCGNSVNKFPLIILKKVIKTHTHTMKTNVLKRAHEHPLPPPHSPNTTIPSCRYAQSLLASIGRPPLSESILKELNLLVDQWWKRVAIFFMLRLVLAPCVESLLLLDRAIFLNERRDSHTHRPVKVKLLPVFDPKISPRNIAIIATK